MASSNIILTLLYLSPFYRAYYKATIKTSTTVERGYYKARYARLSDNCITVIQIVAKSVTKMPSTYNDHFRQATKMATKNRRFKCFRRPLEVVGGYYYFTTFAMSHSSRTHRHDAFGLSRIQSIASSRTE